MYGAVKKTALARYIPYKTKETAKLTLGRFYI